MPYLVQRPESQGNRTDPLPNPRFQLHPRKVYLRTGRDALINPRDDWNEFAHTAPGADYTPNLRAGSMPLGAKDPRVRDQNRDRDNELRQ